MTLTSGLLRRPLAAAIAATAAVSLVACNSTGSEDETLTPSPTSVTTSSSETETSETSASETDEETLEETTETSTSETDAADDDLGEGVADAREIFASLLPADIWREFDSCSPTGIADSYECSGREVGQFQLFESASKAASTTQLLTELRSSRVVRDTGRFVIGWSTLGTTAVITVVDNDKGLVAQQLMSSDQKEPDEKIAELGLDEPAGISDDTSATDTEWETYKSDFESSTEQSADAEPAATSEASESSTRD